LTVDITCPPGAASKDGLPVLVWIHGMQGYDALDVMDWADSSL
jgi:carboxylesterase type B